MPKKRKRNVGGRPPFKATPARRSNVELYLACGMSIDSIAKVIGCTEPTLRKHFAAEISFGVAKKRAEVLGMLHASAKNGNVSAQKHLEAMTGRAVTEESFNADREPVRAPRAAQIGKKQAAADAASTAGDGTPWSDDLQPPPSALRN